MEHEAIQKETSKHVLARVERLSKEKVEKEEEHAQEIEDVIIELKSSAAENICEAKIKMAQDVKNGNARSQNMNFLGNTQAKLTGKHVNSSQDPTDKKKEKVGG